MPCGELPKSNACGMLVTAESILHELSRISLTPVYGVDLKSKSSPSASTAIELNIDLAMSMSCKRLTTASSPLSVASRLARSFILIIDCIARCNILGA